MYQLFIDGNEANTTKRVGSNAYAWGMLKSLEKLTKTDKNLTCQILLSTPPVPDLPKARARWQYQVLTPATLFSQWALPLYLKKQAATGSVLYTPGHYAPRFCPIPYVCSVMDLGYLEFPDHFTLKDRVQLSAWTAHSVKTAAKVVCISEFTKQEVIKKYHLNPTKLVVAPPGNNVMPTLTSHQKAKIKRQLKLNYPYFLFLGTLQPRKNVVRLIEGYEKFIDQLLAKKKLVQDRVPRLLIVGKTGWLAQDSLKAITNSSARLYIKRFGFVTDEQKQVLLHFASALVLPGYYEGFGIPVLEAFHHHTLVLAANSGSLPEVVGQAGLLFSPLSTSEISRALASAFAMTEAERLRLIKLANWQLRKFTYEHSAKTVLAHIKELLKNHDHTK